MNSESKRIIDEIKRRRKMLNISQTELAERCRMPQSTIGRIENYSMNPSLDVITLIMNELDVSIYFDKKINMVIPNEEKAIKLILKENTTFDLFFYDGSIKRYDILLLSNKYPQLNELKDRKLFLNGHLLGWSGVVWNDELDVSAETVYFEGIDVTDEYDCLEIINNIKNFKSKEKRIHNKLLRDDFNWLINSMKFDNSRDKIKEIINLYSQDKIDFEAANNEIKLLNGDIYKSIEESSNTPIEDCVKVEWK